MDTGLLRPLQGPLGWTDHLENGKIFFLPESRRLMKKSKCLRASPLECTDINGGPWPGYPFRA